MAQPSFGIEPITPLVSVIGSQFIAQDEFNVIVNRQSSKDLVITDYTNQKLMFTVKSCDTFLHAQRLVRDANETPIVLLRGKIMSAHDRWNVYRGESNADQDMIFNTVSNHMIQFKTHVKVFLANKTSSRDDHDFKIKGNWPKKNCNIYIGDSSTVIAEMHKMQPHAKDDKFMVTIYPKVDYAFVVALIALVDAMKSQEVGAGAAAAEGAIGGVVGSTVEHIIAGIIL